MMRGLKTILAAAMMSASCFAGAQAQEFKKENFNYSKFADSLFSEAVTITGPAKTIYLAGIGSEDPETGVARHPGDLLAQCTFAWEKIKSALAANGATLSDIVKVTTYVTDIRFRDEMFKCRTQTFEGIPLPPHTLLNVVQLARPGMMFEADVVAAVAVK
ncbi:RidA family protein [Terrihabitans sp. B22-R8]|uniref:RidA family protein n=1 Tax=Terrihabitans sp. B22-R8 TaxID=3425128 RepID=UPI00403CBEAD